MKYPTKFIVLAAITLSATACQTSQPASGLSLRAQADQFLYREETLKLNYLNTNRVDQLLKELAAQDYAALEADFDKLDADFKKDAAYELGYRDVMLGVAGCDTVNPALEKELQDWVVARPQSAWSHLVMGSYYLSAACSVRGEDWASTVTDERWKRMDAYLAKAKPELEQARQLNPMLWPVYSGLIQLAKQQSDPQAAEQAMLAGHKVLPQSYLIAAWYMDVLSPRWLGSYEQMHAFANSMLPDLGKNARYWDLQGYVDAEEGDVAYRQNDLNTALGYYNVALRYADYRRWLVFAGESERGMGNYGAALHYYERNARYEKPLSPHTSSTMDFIISMCQRVPGTCKVDASQYPWYGEPGPHDPADDGLLK